MDWVMDRITSPVSSGQREDPIDTYLKALEAHLDDSEEGRTALAKVKQIVDLLRPVIYGNEVVGRDGVARYNFEPRLVDFLVSKVMKACPDIGNVASLYELYSCVERAYAKCVHEEGNEASCIRDAVETLMFAYAYIARASPSIPTFFPYDPRCRPKSMRLYPTPATTPETEMVGGGLTIVVTADCPSPDSDKPVERVFSSQILYTSIEATPPAYREHNKPSWSFNAVLFHPVLPVNVSLLPEEGVGEGGESVAKARGSVGRAHRRRNREEEERVESEEGVDEGAEDYVEE